MESSKPIAAEPKMNGLPEEPPEEKPIEEEENPLIRKKKYEP